MDAPVAAYQARIRLFRRHGYDIPKARAFIASKVACPRGTILELGTGKGYMALALAQRGYALTSIDVDRGAQRIARGVLRALGHAGQVTFRIADVEQLPYPDESFDWVVAVNILHHCARPLECLQQMLRVARLVLVVAELNGRGQRAVERVYRTEGRHHEHTSVDLALLRYALRGASSNVRQYRGYGQTVFVVQK